jgi:ubiquinone biosynthesis protein
VRQVVDADIAIMDLLAHRLEAAFAEARALNLSAMVHEFERAMHMELDLRHEARHLARFRTMFEGRPAVKIPRVIPELCTAEVLVMELVHGRKITEAAADLPPERRDDLVRVCFDILFTMVLEERVFHGDLHPGNVFLAEDGAVALLDMGLVGRLSPTMRDQVVDVLVALGQGDWNGVAEAFYEMAVRTRPVALRAFVAEVAEVMDASIAGRTLAELELGSVLGQLGELGVRFGMRVPSEYAMMIKAVLTVEGLGRTLAPTVNPVEAARPYVEAAIRQRYAPERLGSEGLRALLTVTRTARELPHALREVLSSVEGGRARVGVDLQTARDLGPTLRAALSPVTDAVLLAGLDIAGALALRHGEAVAFGIPMVSLVLFGLGAGVLLRLVFRRRR